eukprot:RCo012131
MPAPEKPANFEALAAKIDEIMRQYLQSEPTEPILALVDEAFTLLGDNVEHICQLLDFLPRALTTKKFQLVLEKERSKRSAMVAKANLAALPELKLDLPSKRKIYLLMHECLNCEPACAEDAHRMLVSYLSTFTKVEEYSGEVEEKARLVILNSLRLPIWHFDEVSDLVPVRALAASKTPSNRLLFSLFDVFCCKGINEYQNLYTANAELVEQTWGLHHTDLLEKIRILSLCRLAQARRVQGRETVLSYSDVATALGLDDEQLEPILIKAVGLRLLSCRMDPIKKTVKFGFTQHAMFTHDQWSQLQETLGAWKDSIAELEARFVELNGQQYEER